MKKAVCLIMALTLMVLFSISSFAGVAKVSTRYEYQHPNGSVVYYYLDKNGNPYNYVNGKIMYTALALDHLKVTDPEKIAELNTAIGKANTDTGISTRAIPTNPVNLTVSPYSYSKNIVFGTAQSISTQALHFYSKHNAIRVKSTDLVKKHWYSSTTISFTYYFCDISGTWSSLYFGDINCNGVNGFGFQSAFGPFPYGLFDVWNDGNLTSFTFNVRTTTMY
ncbi:MAG TPA: hypothetical protein VFC76_05585 [Oscillospiraceae bacterium]|nr:hypothetical protein [Clostridiales bacterium]HZK21732.1 hypothetical protein [Oscillospiraceae bacterium]